MSKTLKEDAVKGALWSFSSRACVQVVQFVIAIILARLLSPEDYGVVGLAYVAIALVECFANLGIGGAIIQKKEVDELDYNTCFWAELCVRLLVFGIVFFIAPYFARYYGKPILVKLIRVIVISGLLGVACAIPNLKLTRAMDFKTTSWIGVVSTLTSGVLAVIAAFCGFGMWALVVQNMVGTIVSVPLLLWKVPWRPKLQFSFQKFRHFINFGYKLLFSGILETVYNNISSLIVGKAFSVEALGFYTKGKKLPKMVMESVNGPINNVAFPMFSKLQDDVGKNKAALRKALMTSIFFVAPIMTELAVTAKPVVLLLFGEKWLPAVPFLRIMAIVFVFYPIHTLNLGAITGKGRTDIFLKLEIAKKACGVTLMFLFIPLGLFWFVCSSLIGTVFGVLINTFPMKKLIGYSTWEQITDISKSLLGSVVMALIILPLCFLEVNVICILAIQILLGVIAYIGYYYLFNRVFLFENIDLLRRVKNRSRILDNSNP